MNIERRKKYWSFTGSIKYRFLALEHSKSHLNDDLTILVSRNICVQGICSGNGNWILAVIFVRKVKFVEEDMEEVNSNLNTNFKVTNFVNCPSCMHERYYIALLCKVSLISYTALFVIYTSQRITLLSRLPFVCLTKICTVLLIFYLS